MFEHSTLPLCESIALKIWIVGKTSSFALCSTLQSETYRLCQYFLLVSDHWLVNIASWYELTSLALDKQALIFSISRMPLCRSITWEVGIRNDWLVLWCNAWSGRDCSGWQQQQQGDSSPWAFLWKMREDVLMNGLKVGARSCHGWGGRSGDVLVEWQGYGGIHDRIYGRGIGERLFCDVKGWID